jgi:hypothetical protein
MLAGRLQKAGAVLKVKATINTEKISSFGHQFFFPCGGMAVVKSLLYVNKN